MSPNQANFDADRFNVAVTVEIGSDRVSEDGWVESYRLLFNDGSTVSTRCISELRIIGDIAMDIGLDGPPIAGVVMEKMRTMRPDRSHDWRAVVMARRRQRVGPYAAYVVRCTDALCGACGERIKVTMDVYDIPVGVCPTGRTEQEQLEAHWDRMEADTTGTMR